MLKPMYLFAVSALAKVVAVEDVPVAQPENEPNTLTTPVPVPIKPAPTVKPPTVRVEPVVLVGVVALKSQPAAVIVDSHPLDDTVPMVILFYLTLIMPVITWIWQT